MKIKDVLLWTSFYSYFVLYIFISLVLAYTVSSFYVLPSIPSIIYVLSPFLFLAFIAWIVYKFTGVDDRKDGKRKLLGFVKIGIAPLLILFIILGINEKNSRFDVERWAKHEDKRVLMVDHLLEEHQLVGKKRSEVVELLGKGEAPEGSTHNEVRYYLGASIDSFIPIDVETLVISFDENDKVIKHEVQKS
ncbi:hypothetical protein [Bacillus manliponensis]|uniref:hypothetical protein n=1 Tax=Bacillus manliponensis TaxID=574376 RepID=UPI003512FCB2